MTSSKALHNDMITTISGSKEVELRLSKKPWGIQAIKWLAESTSKQSGVADDLMKTFLELKGMDLDSAPIDSIKDHAYILRSN